MNVTCAKCGGSGLVPVPTPEEEREPRESGQVNLSFPSKPEADSFRELLKLCRERMGVTGRVMAGPIAHAAVYGYLTGAEVHDHS